MSLVEGDGVTGHQFPHDLAEHFKKDLSSFDASGHDVLEKAGGV